MLAANKTPSTDEGEGVRQTGDQAADSVEEDRVSLPLRKVICSR